MIGNDVVDLAQARLESNWLRKGWLEKIFRRQEIRFIESAQSREIAVWSLWSKKESAYKIYNRITGHRRFNPKYFECSSADLGTGLVRAGTLLITVNTEIAGQCLHTIAVLDSDSVHLTRFHDNPLQIEKLNGLPFVRRETGLMPCSVSHHGRFHKCVYLAT